MLKLYPYQQTGVDFIQKHKKIILADEMGLGKTVQAIKASFSNKRDTSVLIVSSKGMKYFWSDEIAKWLPEYITPENVVVGSSNRFRGVHIPLEEDDIDPTLSLYTIVHWDILRTWPNLASAKWSAIIVDEAHKAKNRKAQRTKALWKICNNTPSVIMLTGTPIVNQPADLWSLLKCLHPKTYTSYWRFFKKYVLAAPTPWDPWGGEILGVRNKKELLEELSTLTIRRTKKTVLPQLPDKMHTLIPVEITEKQHKAYNEIRDYMLTELEDGTLVTTPTVLAQITRLRQVTTGLGAFTDPETCDAAKIDAAVDYIEDHEGKTVVATQFVWAANEMARRLNKRGIHAVSMTGKTPEAERNTLVNAFQNEDTPTVLCMTIQTGGEGWTLTAADLMIFLDRPWSPQVVTQAEDRLHRIGQKNSVHIVTLIALGTIEERVEEVLGVKQSIFDSVFGQLKELL
ncbi:hypothetical protein LCGC14_1102200 [marine sediment metagenome]|uniref:Helicase ATP-binding domain-containing protein n=1 Tax=marine sediment metagenome TaxID=412755 RepID=A0A0F9PSF4_9ZZZZ